MISEKSLSQGNSSLWNMMCPFMEQYIRRINSVNSSDEVKMFPGPSIPSGMAAFVMELSFNLYRETINKNIQIYDITNRCLSPSALQLYIENTEMHLARLDQRTPRKVVHISDFEMDCAFKIACNLYEKVDAVDLEGGIVQCDPLFPGCGILSSCYGDVLAGKTLIEVKCVKRAFRSSDMRQLLLYCVLNYAAKKYEIQSIGLFNPRRGVYFKNDLASLVYEISGVNVWEFFHRFTHFLSSSETSL